MSALSDAITGLAATVKRMAGASVTYSRGSTSNDELTATPTTHDYEVLADDGMPTVVRSTDWLFTTSDLTLSETAITPRPGDRITSSGSTYEVMPIGTKPCSAWVDSTGIITRVHTKKVA